MFTKGDKLVVTKDVAEFLKAGEICEVVDNMSDMITFSFGGGMHVGIMTTDECNEHFKKYEEPSVAPTVTEEMIEEILSNSDIDITTVFDKCTVVSCRLPNGFVIVESSACVSPENYDVDAGVAICMDRITDKVWELEGYRLQNELYHSNYCNDSKCSCDHNDGYEEDCDCGHCGDCDECWWK